MPISPGETYLISYKNINHSRRSPFNFGKKLILLQIFSQHPLIRRFKVGLSNINPKLALLSNAVSGKKGSAPPSLTFDESQAAANCQILALSLLQQKVQVLSSYLARALAPENYLHIFVEPDIKIRFLKARIYYYPY